MFDWQQGKWRRETTNDSTWRMTLAGDWAAIRAYEPIVMEQPEGIYGDLIDVFHNSDINIVNVEAVLGLVGEPIPKAGLPLRSDVKAVKSLQAAKFHIACLANNHTFDYGEEGLRSTIDILEQAGLSVVGAGLDPDQVIKPAIQEIQGVKVGVINCAEGEEGRSVYCKPGTFGMDTGTVIRQIQQLKSEGLADVVIVVFHGGREHVPVPPPYVVQQLRQIAQAGADAVVAHHPHVPQGIEIHHGVPIAYSLGNFVFWQEVNLAFRHMGYVLHLDFSGKKLMGCEVTPYVVHPEGLRRMNPALREKFALDMIQSTKPLADVDDIHAAWSAFAQHVGGLEHTLGLLDKLVAQNRSGDNPTHAAAKLKNTFFTPAHYELHSEILDQATRKNAPDIPSWAINLVRHWTGTIVQSYGCY